jgi:NADH:ubiquinone oxidoreductase subunit C
MLINKEHVFYLLTQKPLKYIKLLSHDISMEVLKIDLISLFLKKQSYQLLTATAIDNPHKFNRFLLSYVFTITQAAQRVYLQYNTPLKAVSIINIFASAIWLEREVYDLFGIFFVATTKTNDLRRLLTDYHFKGHPFRKDFTVIGYAEKYYSYRRKTIEHSNWIAF